MEMGWPFVLAERWVEREAVVPQSGTRGFEADTVPHWVAATATRVAMLTAAAAETIDELGAFFSQQMR